MTSTEGVAERRIRSLWLNTKGYADKLLGLATAALGTIWGLHMPDPAEASGPFDWFLKMPSSAVLWFWLMIASAVLWGLAIFVLQRPRYAQLVRAHDEANLSSASKADALESALRSLLRQLGVHCQADGNSFRTSIYYYLEGRFIAVARDSRHPDFAMLPNGKSHYDARLGAIGAAWQSSEYYKFELPARRDLWELKISSLFGYSAEQASRFRMQSRSYAALRIEGHAGAVGVLVFESTQPQGVSQETIKKANASLILAALAEMVSAHAKLTPQVEKAGIVEAKQTSIVQRPWVSTGSPTRKEVQTVLAE